MSTIPERSFVAVRQVSLGREDLEEDRQECRSRLAYLQPLTGTAPSHIMTRREIQLISANGRSGMIAATGITMLAGVSIRHPPSTKSISNLAPISIADLKIETRHRGSVLILRTFVKEWGNNAVNTGVEDEYGRVTALWLSADLMEGGQDRLLPEGAVIAVKEPFFTAYHNGVGQISVWHLSDMISLGHKHPVIPLAFVLSDLAVNHTAHAFKDRGNAAFKVGNYTLALQHYGSGLALCTDEDDEQHAALLCNRAQLNLMVGKFEMAIADAKTAITLLPPPDHVSSAVKVKHAQAHYRTGKAHYALGDFQSAAAEFEAALILAPGDVLIAKEQARTSDRLRELLTGEYKYEEINKKIDKAELRQDIASFLKYVEVRTTSSGQQGLFTIKDIKAGELIMCEKALAVNYGLRPQECYSRLVFTETDQVAENSRLKVWWSLVQWFRNNPEHGVRMFKLDNGSDLGPASFPRIDGVTVMDSFRLLDIILQHAHSCSELRRLGYQETSFEANYTSGFWFMASYIRHACLSNTMQSIKGDMFILRATRDLRKGEELRMPYLVYGGDFEETTKTLHTRWGITCDCALCAADQQLTQGRFRNRREKAAIVHPTTHSMALTEPQLRMKISMLRRLYATERYAKLPKFWVAALESVVAESDLIRNKTLNGVRYALDCLKDWGYMITFRGDLVEIDRTYALVVDTVIDTMLDLAVAYKKLKKAHFQASFIEAARLTHIMIFGEDVEFEKSVREREYRLGL